jgi:ectoine hydroxylase-related dioxygenase (phytanoyl-CoA dioxygenase family)
MIEEIASRGFATVPDVVAPTLIRELIALLSSEALTHSERRGQVYGIRDLLYLEGIRALALSPPIREIVSAFLGPDARAVRGIFFDKTEGANWPVAWHQDLSLAVREKLELSGWGNWSVKNGIPHVQPPAEVLERMLTLRLHLDDCNTDNGPLKVRAGTHRLGRLSGENIRALATEIPEELCCAEAGAVLAMRPLLLHASGAAAKPRHRRVIHLEFAPADLLPSGLEWAFA